MRLGRPIVPRNITKVLPTYDDKNVQKWYFVTKIVLTYCVKKIVLVIAENF